MNVTFVGDTSVANLFIVPDAFITSHTEGSLSTGPFPWTSVYFLSEGTHFGIITALVTVITIVPRGRDAARR